MSKRRAPKIYVDAARGDLSIPEAIEALSDDFIESDAYCPHTITDLRDALAFEHARAERWEKLGQSEKDGVP
jgi:hypothetical protein